MNSFMNLTNEISQRWAEGILAVLWQSALLGLLVFLATRGLRRASAAVRFWLWMLIPLRLLAMPLLTVTLPLLPAPLAADSTLSSAATTPVIVQVQASPADSAVLPDIAEGSSVENSLVEPDRENGADRVVYPSVWTVLMAVWVLGMFLFCLRLWHSGRRIHRITGQARAAADTNVLRAAEKSAPAMSLKRRPRILVTEAEISPFTLGIIHPRVVLPESFIRKASPEQLQAVLTHEFAHIRRRDPVLGWLLAICETIYFFHPILHLAKRYLMLERETACDEQVLARRHTRPDIYAHTLIDAAEAYQGSMRQTAAIAIMAEPGSQLRKRLSRIVANLTPRARLSWISILFLWLAGMIAIPGINLTARQGTENANSGGATDENIAYDRIEVTVTDAAGEPVAGAGVEALANYKPAADGVTDGSGKVTLKLPADKKVIWIVALKAGVGFDYFENYQYTHFRPAAENPQTVDLVLDGARRFTLRAVDTAGQELPGIPFVPWTIIKPDKSGYVNLSGSRLARVLTDGQGRARFEWFPVSTSEGTNPKSLRKGTGFLVQDVRYYRPDYPEKAYKDYESETTVQLLKSTTVSGRVYLPDGGLVGGITVLAEGRGNTCYICRRQTVTKADGSYELLLYPRQSYMIGVADEHWAAKSLSQIIVKEKQELKNLDLHLIPGTLIHGQVMAEVKPLTGETRPPGPYHAAEVGKPVLLMQIGEELGSDYRYKGPFSALTQKESLNRRVRTDREGRYAFRVGPGDYLIGDVGAMTHSDQGKRVTVSEQKEIVLDFNPGSPALGVTGAIAWAHQGDVYDAATIFNNCEYCHAPLNQPPKPR